MKDVDYNVLTAAVAFVLFFAVVFGAMAYVEFNKAECRKAAIEKNMTASDIQAVCGR